MRVIDLESIRIKVASPEDILNWSRGEVTKPETINYRTQKPEKDGLFCERIFGPEKDYECYCGKYRRIRYKGVVCDKCGVEVIKSSVRRDRLGHIKLSCPVSHIWFLKGVPSRMSTVLNIPAQQLEKVIYFAAYIITNVDEGAKKNILQAIEKEYKTKFKSFDSSNLQKESEKIKKTKIILQNLKEARAKAREEVLELRPFKILSEAEYHDLSLKYGEIFEAGIGAEALKKIFEKIDLKKEIEKIKKETEEDLSALPVKINKTKNSAAVSKKTLIRFKFLQNMLLSGLRPEWMFLTVLPVLPPDLRPMVQLDGGRYAASDLNDLYRRVINRNNRLRYLLEINAPEVIVRNEKRMLQEAVDALIDNNMRKGTVTTATTGGKRLLKSLADILKGKQGRFRQNLLGKRVDYSGRSVIVVGPELRLHQCGIPKKMALELFKPFVIKKVLEKELSYNVRGASKLIEEEGDEIWAILEEVVRNKLVLLNRAPTLHRLGIQAFYPVLIEGESIKIHPLVCEAFNADFDGDQMAVHLPLSEKSQIEAKEIMLSTNNLLKPATGTPIVAPDRDIVLGCYFLTTLKEGAKGEGKIFASFEEAILAYELGEIDLGACIQARMPQRVIDKLPTNIDKSQHQTILLKTSVGRILFNEVLPEDYFFQNETMNSRKIKELIGKIIRNDSSQVPDTLDKIKDLGFEMATISGVSWGMDDLVIPKEKKELIKSADKEVETIIAYYKKGFLSKEEKTAKVIEIWQRVKSEIERLVPLNLPAQGSVFSIIDSGARGSWSQPVQMAGMKGLVINPAGQIIELPVKSSFKEGLDVLEYFISTHGARKGTTDTALRTATAGYLTRRLVDVSHEIIIFEEDCGDKKGTEVIRKDAEDTGQSFSFKLVGRIVLENIKDPQVAMGGEKNQSFSKKVLIVKANEIIDWNAAAQINEAKIDKVLVRSPLSCQSLRGVCQKCYGWDLGRNHLVKMGEAVGIVSAQGIGEPGTQLTMRTFHVGGVAGGGDITQGLPRVEEIFEARSPGGKAIISTVEGEIVEITEEGTIKIKTEAETQKSKTKNKKKKKNETVEFKMPVKQAVWVKVGQSIKKGQQLCEGNIDLKEFFKVTNKEDSQCLIIKEIQKIYTSQGAIIHDKHLEVIVRQMFSRVKIQEAGESCFIVGEIIEQSYFFEENARLEREKKKPAVAVSLLLGISRVAITAESFLSAASFQETSKVLIKAAIEGKEDRLRGLKENVIIGKLIPAGTGFRK